MVIERSRASKPTIEKSHGKEAGEKNVAATREMVPFIRRHLALSITLLVAGLILIGAAVYFILKVLPGDRE